jgi:hypothetical protein
MNGEAGRAFPGGNTRKTRIAQLGAGRRFANIREGHWQPHDRCQSGWHIPARKNRSLSAPA